MQTVPQLLELLAQVEPQNDPRGMQQRYLSFALFDRGGMLSRSLDGVDREALYKAVRAGLKNQDGRARGSIGSVYRNLSTEDIQPLRAPQKPCQTRVSLTVTSKNVWLDEKPE